MNASSNSSPYNFCCLLIKKVHVKLCMHAVRNFEFELLPGALCINSNLQLLLINIEHEVLPIEDCATGMSEEPQESFYTTMCTAYVTSSSMAALKLAPGTLQFGAGRKRPWVIFLLPLCMDAAMQGHGRET